MRVLRVGPTALRVGPAEVETIDILEYAKAAIEEFGWFKSKGMGGSPASGNPTKEETAKHGKGLTLHDAIGLACVELSKVYGEEPVGKASRTGTKDWKQPVSTPTGQTKVENLRAKATEALFPNELDPLGGRADFRFNDDQDDVQPVYDLLDEAIQRERAR